MLDEFGLHRDTLRELQQICVLQPDARIDRLRRLVSDCPEQTAPAILLLLAMRHAGLFAAKGNLPRSGIEARIPKRIVHYWHNGTPPPDVRQIMASWHRKHPDYEHILFDDGAAANFLRAKGLGTALQAFRQSSSPAQRADILRLAYLFSLGGFFVDADDRCLAPIGTFILPCTQFAGYQESYGTIGANFLGATEGHPVIARALENGITAVNRGDRDVAWLSTGPGLLTRAFAERISIDTDGDWVGKIRLLELWEFQRVVGVHCPAEYKRSKLH